MDDTDPDNADVTDLVVQLCTRLGIPRYVFQGIFVN